MFASTCSFTKNHPLCMVYYPYHFVGEVLLHPVYIYEVCSFSNLSVTSPMSQLILTLPSLYLRHSSFFNPSVASLTSQFILQPFFRFFYVTSSSLNSPGEPPMVSEKLFHVRSMILKCSVNKCNCESIKSRFE